MSLLSACQEASVQIMSRAPSTFFSSTANFEVELRTLANIAARDIAAKGDWRALTKLQEMTGDGTTVGFDLPTDYERMLAKGDVHPSSWTTWVYTPATDLDQWRFLRNGMSAVSPGFWIILESQMQFQPVIPTGEIAQFYYITKNIVRSEAGTTKVGFTADSDTFLLDENLLSAALIWRWRAMKRLEYAEDMNNYEIMLSEKLARERGPRIIAVGAPTYSRGINIAYPNSLGS